MISGANPPPDIGVVRLCDPLRSFSRVFSGGGRSALLRQFERLGETTSPDTWADRVTAPASLQEACAAGEKAEVENGAMYDRLLQKITDPTVNKVMRRLQEASQERHLPAFRRCQQHYS